MIGKVIPAVERQRRDVEVQEFKVVLVGSQKGTPETLFSKKKKKSSSPPRASLIISSTSPEAVFVLTAEGCGGVLGTVPRLVHQGHFGEHLGQGNGKSNRSEPGQTQP